MWRAVEAKALPLVRFMFGSSFSIQWHGHKDAEQMPMRHAGRKGTVEMPRLWETYMDHVLGSTIEVRS